MVGESLQFRFYDFLNGKERILQSWKHNRVSGPFVKVAPLDKSRINYRLSVRTNKNCSTADLFPRNFRIELLSTFNVTLHFPNTEINKIRYFGLRFHFCSGVGV